MGQTTWTEEAPSPPRAAIPQACLCVTEKSSKHTAMGALGLGTRCPAEPQVLRLTTFSFPQKGKKMAQLNQGERGQVFVVFCF